MLDKRKACSKALVKLRLLEYVLANHVRTQIIPLEAVEIFAEITELVLEINEDELIDFLQLQMKVLREKSAKKESFSPIKMPNTLQLRPPAVEWRDYVVLGEENLFDVDTRTFQELFGKLYTQLSLLARKGNAYFAKGNLTRANSVLLVALDDPFGEDSYRILNEFQKRLK